MSIGVGASFAIAGIFGGLFGDGVLGQRGVQKYQAVDAPQIEQSKQDFEDEDKSDLPETSTQSTDQKPNDEMTENQNTTQNSTEKVNYTADCKITENAGKVHIEPNNKFAFIPDVKIEMSIKTMGAEITGVSVNGSVLKADEFSVTKRNDVTSVDFSYIFKGSENCLGTQSFVEIEGDKTLSKNNVYLQSFYVSGGDRSFREMDFILDSALWNSHRHWLSLNGDLTDSDIPSKTILDQAFKPGQKICFSLTKISGDVVGTAGTLSFEFLKDGAVGFDDRFYVDWRFNGECLKNPLIVVDESLASRFNGFKFVGWVASGGTTRFDNCVYEIHIFTWGGVKNFKEISLPTCDKQGRFYLNGAYASSQLPRCEIDCEFKEGQTIYFGLKLLRGDAPGGTDNSFAVNFLRDGVADGTYIDYRLNGALVRNFFIKVTKEFAQKYNGISLQWWVGGDPITFTNCEYEIHVYIWE